MSTAEAPLEAPTSTGDYRLEAGINAGGKGSLPPAVGVGSLPVTEAVSGEPDLPSFGLKSPRGRSPVERAPGETLGGRPVGHGASESATALTPSPPRPAALTVGGARR